MIGKIAKGMAKGILGAASLKSSKSSAKPTVDFKVSGKSFTEDGARVSDFTNKPKSPTPKQPNKITQPKALDTTDLTSTIVGAVKSYGGRQVTNYGKQAADKVRNETGIQDVSGISPNLNNNFVILGRQISYVTDALIQNDNRINELEVSIDRKFHKATTLILNTTSGLIKSVHDDFYAQKALLHEIEDKVNLHDEQIDRLESKVDYLEAKDREPQKNKVDEPVKISSQDKEDLTKQASDGILSGLLSGFGGAVGTGMFGLGAGLGFGAVGAVIAAYAAKKVADGIMDGISDAKNAVGDWLSKKSNDVEAWFVEKKKQLSDIFDSGVKAGDPYRGRGGKNDPDFSKNRKPYLMDKPAVIPETPTFSQVEKKEETKSVVSETDIYFTSNKDIFMSVKRDIRLKAEKIVFDAKTIEFIGEVTGNRSGSGSSSTPPTPQSQTPSNQSSTQSQVPSSGSSGGLSATNPNPIPPPMSMEKMERLSRSLPGNMMFNDAPSGARMGRRRIGGYSYSGGTNDGPSPDPIDNVTSSTPAPSSSGDTGDFTFDDLSEKAGFGFRFGKFKENGVKGLIVHHTAGRGKASGVINTFRERNFPAQWIMDRDGKVYRALTEGAKGQHMRSGQGPGKGLSNANMEGIEVIARDNSDWTPAQIAAMDKFSRYHSQKYGYNPRTHTFGHGEVNFHKERDEGLAWVNSFRERFDKGEWDVKSDKSQDQTPGKSNDEPLPMAKRAMTWGMKKDAPKEETTPTPKPIGPSSSISSTDNITGGIQRDELKTGANSNNQIPDGKFKVLADQRARFFEEMERDPKLKATVQGLMMAENGRNPLGPLESLMNRAAMRNSTIKREVYNGFYGPINRGQVTPGIYKKVEAAFEEAKTGSNTIGLRTDQGMINEHKYADSMINSGRPELGGKAKFDGEWYSYMGKKGYQYAINTQKLIDAEIAERKKRANPQLAEANQMIDESRNRRLNPNMFSIKKPSVDPKKINGPMTTDAKIARVEQKANPSGGITGGDRIKKEEPPASQTASSGGSGGNGHDQISNPRNSECDSVPPSPGDDGAGDYRPCLI